MYQNILVPIDLAHRSSWRKALPVAIENARHWDAKLNVITVVPEIDIGATAVHYPKGFGRKIQEEAKERLNEILQQEAPKDLSVQGIVEQGSIYREILRVAQDIKADLIIMASHRPELTDYLIGSNAARVVRHAQCSVLVVRE